MTDTTDRPSAREIADLLDDLHALYICHDAPFGSPPMSWRNQRGRVDPSGGEDRWQRCRARARAVAVGG